MSVVSKRNFGLDLLRCIAIVLVIIQHCRHLLPNKTHKAIMMLKGGFYGVEIFFVLSGFLIGSIFLNNVILKNEITLQSIKNFWVRRWFRTIPNYYLAIFIHIGTLFLLKKDLSGFGISYFFFFQNFAWPYPDFFHASWSLSVEEWFYLTLPIMSLIGFKWLKFQSPTQFFVLCIIFLTLIRFLYIT